MIQNNVLIWSLLTLPAMTKINPQFVYENAAAKFHIIELQSGLRRIMNHRVANMSIQICAVAAKLEAMRSLLCAPCHDQIHLLRLASIFFQKRAYLCSRILPDVALITTIQQSSLHCG